jgi:3'(2'), 5'-bisphosphate nucleotidase
MAETLTLDALVALALAAGREIMAVRDAGFTATDKADGSPVTIADQRAEAIIEAGLARLAPGVPMLGEEASSEGRKPVLGSRFFCVDPIDGTKDFIEGETGEFTVNIALIENGAPSMGVVLAPATGALYAAEPGRAFKGTADARKETINEALRPIQVARHSGAWRVIASRRHGKGGKLDQFIETLGDHVKLAASSSIKFCRLAEGDADIYPRLGQVSEWDAAAGHAVLNAAGGGVMRLDGEPLTYGNVGVSFLVDGLIAYSGDDAKAAALRAMKGVKG